MSPQVLVSPGRGREAQGRRRLRPKEVFLALAAVAAACLAPGARTPVAAAAGGAITGHIRFTGPEPGNRVIRMGMDPMCAAANRGKQPVNDVYLVGDNNALGNVFVKVEGTFP